MAVSKDTFTGTETLIPLSGGGSESSFLNSIAVLQCNRPDAIDIDGTRIRHCFNERNESVYETLSPFLIFMVVPHLGQHWILLRTQGPLQSSVYHTLSNYLSNVS